MAEAFPVAKMDAAPDSSWLVDMMITIMHSNTWNEPLNAFINDKCTIFDNFEEEMKHEYVTVHIEFKCLVDNLLAAHLLEVDISPEDFEKQLLESGLVEDPRLQQVVGQLMAAEDFLTFKQMMVERHCNMQHQAESNYKELAAAEDMAAAEAAAMAASQQAAAAQASLAPPPPPPPPPPVGAAVGHPAPAYAHTGAVPAPMPTSNAAPSQAPTMQQERAFGAGGGFYGRATMPTAKAQPNKEKADAIRKALVGALRPR